MMSVVSKFLCMLFYKSLILDLPVIVIEFQCCGTKHTNVTCFTEIDIIILIQVDLEMSFVNSEGIMSLVEDLLSTTLVQAVPHLKITSPPFPRMNYKTVIKKVLSSSYAMHYDIYAYYLYCSTKVTSLIFVMIRLTTAG